jgi:hypothetical protein
MTGNAPKDQTAREARLSEALRANLKRRKDGARRQGPRKQSDDRPKEQGNPE